MAGATAAYALAFMAIYLRPHIQVTASQWFNHHVPSGSRVLSQDWDEGFPLPLPGIPSDRTKVVQFGFYEPDTAAKTTRLARELAASDVVVLQTKRLYGAVTMAPQRYPTTVRFFQLLFAGDLGFRLEAEFASRPSFFGLELPSELADESFSVYDHPKAVIFTRTQRLPATELERRILTATPSRPLTRTDLLLARAGSAPAPRPAVAESRLVRSSWAAATLVLLWLELAGLVGWVLLASYMDPRPGLFAAGQVFGVLAATLPAWLVVYFKWVPLGRSIIVVGWLAIAGIAVALWRRKRIPVLPMREALLVGALTSTAFIAIVALRAFNPEIYWGEKPMDSAFLRVLYRADTLPPPEPWLAGTPLSYTYFGHYVVAAIGRGLDIDPAIMFNLGLGVT
ncbi:MAG: hypothetical protein GW878_04100, partial [Acidobacteria bacterium]|nr:hypothetical protein [Acidobacteriota bacterium]